MHRACTDTVYSTDRFLLNYDSLATEEPTKILKWSKDNSQVKYIGGITQNNLHDFGYYFQTGKKGKPDYLYEGSFYCNRINGYGNIIYNNCTYIEALFKNNTIFGPAVITDDKGFQDVAWFQGTQIIRLITPVLPNCIPKLENADKQAINFELIEKNCDEYLSGEHSFSKHNMRFSEPGVNNSASYISRHAITVVNEKGHVDLVDSNIHITLQIEGINTNKHPHFDKNVDATNYAVKKKKQLQEQIQSVNDNIRNIDSKFFNESLFCNDCCNKFSVELFLKDYCTELFGELNDSDIIAREKSLKSDSNHVMNVTFQENKGSKTIHLSQQKLSKTIYNSTQQKLSIPFKNNVRTSAQNISKTSESKSKASQQKISKTSVKFSKSEGKSLEDITNIIPYVSTCKFTTEEVYLIELKNKLLINNIDYDEMNNEINLLETFTDFSKNANIDILKDMLKHSFHNRHCLNNINFDIKYFLNENRNMFLKPGIKETACTAFLHKCYEGNTLAATVILNKFNLSPDVCDSNGNSGLLFAVFQNKHDIVRMLCEYGVDLNYCNNDGINALTLSILKYLALHNNIPDCNWSRAFMNKENVKNAESKAEDELIENDTLVDFGDCVFLENSKDFYFFEQSNNSTNCSFELQPQPISSGSRFLLNLNLVKTCKSMQKAKGKKGKGKPKKKKKKKKKEKKGKSKGTKKSAKGKKKSKHKLKSKKSSAVSEPKEDGLKKYALSEIFQMFSLLLKLGANPNVGSFPMPVLFLSLFYDTPELLLLVLKHNANVSLVWGQDGLTVLHVLMCSATKTTEMILEMLKILIEHGVKLNARTNSSHWEEERKCIIGEYPELEIDDKGKTALHILAMRQDLDDVETITRTLIKAGASTKIAYLGHTPLSLAVLKGNPYMVRALLDNRAKVDQILTNGMGKPLTIYFLMRYEKVLPDIARCKYILDIILDHDNPFNPIENYGNVFEFIRSEEIKSKPEVPGKKGKKKKSSKSDKKSKKTKKGGKKNKSNKNEAKSVRSQLLKYFLKLTKQIIITHYQSKVLLHLIYIAKHSNLETDEFCSKIVKFISVDTAIAIIGKLIQRYFIDISAHTDRELILKILLYINSHAEKSEETKAILRKMARIKSRFSFYHKVNIRVPSPKRIIEIWRRHTFRSKTQTQVEFDEDFFKYRVCFNCFERTGKVLLPCPACGVVCFCSEHCNKVYKDHLCKLVFYKNKDVSADNGEDLFKSSKGLYHLIKNRKHFE